jgi:hypothetical protein
MSQIGRGQKSSTLPIQEGSVEEAEISRTLGARRRCGVHRHRAGAKCRAISAMDRAGCRVHVMMIAPASSRLSCREELRRRPFGCRRIHVRVFSLSAPAGLEWIPEDR